MFFWNSLAFSMIQQMLAMWSLIPLPFLNSVCISGSSHFIYCWNLSWRTFSILNKAEADVFLEFSCFFYEPTDVDNLIFGSSAFSKSSLNIWKFLVHILLKANLEDFEQYFASLWNECNWAVVWTVFGIDLLWYWKWKLNFSSPMTV